jgi:hypothetical protein
MDVKWGNSRSTEQLGGTERSYPVSIALELELEHWGLSHKVRRWGRLYAGPRSGGGGGGGWGPVFLVAHLTPPPPPPPGGTAVEAGAAQGTAIEVGLPL